MLLTAYQTMKIAYPSPPLPVGRGVLAMMRAIAEAPRPQECAHADEHPTLRDTQFRIGMAHFYAPQEFPAPAGEFRSLQAWTCPLFAGAVALAGQPGAST